MPGKFREEKQSSENTKGANRKRRGMNSFAIVSVTSEKKVKWAQCALGVLSRSRRLRRRLVIIRFTMHSYRMSVSYCCVIIINQPVERLGLIRGKLYYTESQLFKTQLDRWQVQSPYEHCLIQRLLQHYFDQLTMTTLGPLDQSKCFIH